VRQGAGFHIMKLQGETILHWQAVESAERFSLPAVCDGHYLALAARLGNAFWAADAKLARTVQANLP